MRGAAGHSGCLSLQLGVHSRTSTQTLTTFGGLQLTPLLCSSFFGYRDCLAHPMFIFLCGFGTSPTLVYGCVVHPSLMDTLSAISSPLSINGLIRKVGKEDPHCLLLPLWSMCPSVPCTGILFLLTPAWQTSPGCSFAPSWCQGDEPKGLPSARARALQLVPHCVCKQCLGRRETAAGTNNY